MTIIDKKQMTEEDIKLNFSILFLYVWIRNCWYGFIYDMNIYFYIYLVGITNKLRLVNFIYVFPF